MRNWRRCWPGRGAKRGKMVEAARFLRKFTSGETLSEEESRGLFDDIMEGGVEPLMLAAMMGAMATRGETVEELVGAARAMRSRVTRVRVPGGREAIDTCGTGGDGKPTFNVSTAAAIVAAGAGAVVAKHGNRSASRPSGSAECMTALGISIDATVPVLERCLEECGVAFLYAPGLHPAMKHAAPVRKALGIRTIFNLLGPLTNPAGVKRQLMGVSRPEHVELMIEALKRLGAERAMVVHGMEGLCDVSIAGPTRIGTLDGGVVRIETVEGGMVGVKAAATESVYVDSPQASARVIEGVLDGASGPAREMVVLNAAAALWVAGVSTGWEDGACRARESIDTGAAGGVLKRWRAVSTGK